MRDVSIRLTTLGRKPGAAILAIGAVMFDPKTGKQGSTFYEEIKGSSAAQSCELGHQPNGILREDFEDESLARLMREIADDNPKKLHLPVALDRLAAWTRNQAAGVPIPWARDFSDITILEHAYMYHCVGLSEPWYFTNVRSYYTALAVLNTLRPEYKPNVKSSGIASSALVHAQDMAHMISECYQALNTTEDDEL